jgi:hypothetical protein
MDESIASVGQVYGKHFVSIFGETPLEKAKETTEIFPNMRMTALAYPSKGRLKADLTPHETLLLWDHLGLKRC